MNRLSPLPHPLPPLLIGEGINKNPLPSGEGRTKSGVRLVLGLSLAIITIIGCKSWKKPTYKAEFVAQELRKMCLHDYKMTVETRHAGNTLQAFFWRVGLLRSGELEMQPEAAEALERVLLCATRISLSTDAPLQFLEVKMMDALTGATVTLWRFVPDIRDSMLTRMSEDEYINRLVIEFDTGASINPLERARDWQEVSWDAPLTMQQFLAKQVVLRVKRSSAISVQAHEDISNPSKLVMVVDNWSAIEKQGSKQQEKVTTLAEKTAKTVLHGYRYKGFHDFELKDQRGMALKSWAL
jgi:hypothetical protein